MSVNLARPRPPFPYDLLPPVPAFELASADLSEGAPVPERFTALGQGVSPELHWSGFPGRTRSFAVTCLDPDAPTGSGWWHWVVVDLAPSTTCLAQGAGASDLGLDGAAFHVRGDNGEHAYFGPCPPAGDGVHRYVFAVSALDVESLGLDEDATPAAVGFTVVHHCIARATLTATFEVQGVDGAAPFLRDAQ